jgi:hypothetical protein
VVPTSSGSYTLVQNEQLYDAPGAYYWICPAGVTSVCVLCIGGGGAGAINGGGGGAYAYINDYPVTPGQGYLVVVGAGADRTGVNGVNGSVSYGSAERASGTGYNGNAWNTFNYATFYSGSDSKSNPPREGGDGSYFNNFSTVFAGGGENGRDVYNPSAGTTTTFVYGGVGYYNPTYSGGGARGARGAGGKYQVGSVSPYASPTRTYGRGGGAGAGGALGDTGGGTPEVAGGGGFGFGSSYLTGDGSHTEPGPYFASGGGGIGVYGIGTSGADGTAIVSTPSIQYGSGGGGGSGGQPGIGGALQIRGGDGGKYGGGGGGGAYYSGVDGSVPGYGAPGAVRIIWGAGRTFPNTSTTSVTSSVTIPLPNPRTYQIFLQAALFTAPGAYTWICPAGVTSISVMCVGGGGAGSATGGGGGGYAYIYDYPTTPGQGYLVVVGAGGKAINYDGIDPNVSYGNELRLSGSGNGQVGYDINGNTYWWSGSTSGYSGVPGGDASYFNSYTTCVGGGGESGARFEYGPLSGGLYADTNYPRGGIYIVGAGLSGTGVRGGRGGQSQYSRGSISPMSGDGYEFGGGGGAGGNTNNSFESYGGGNAAGAGSGGGSGGYGNSFNNYFSPVTGFSGGGGGGIGILGIGTSAAGPDVVGGAGGLAGSGGQAGTTNTSTGRGSPGGKYGGGGGGSGFLSSTYPSSGRSHTGNNGRTTSFLGGDGGDGVVRIVWGASRAYPSTNTGEITTTVTF